MTDSSLRARSITEIVDAAFTLYRRDLLQYVVVCAVAYAPAFVAALILRPDQAIGVGGIGRVIASMFVSVLSGALMSGAVTLLGSRAYLGQPVDAAAAIREAVPRVPTLVLSAIVMTLLYLLGFLCFFVGFFYVFARFFAVTPTIVLERASVGQALSRSTSLSTGHLWHVLGAMVLVFGIYFLASMGVSMVALVTGSALAQLFVSAIFTIVAFPVAGLANMVLYYDMRIRAEGFDLEYMTAGLARPAGV